MKYTFIISVFFAISCTNMFSQNISQTDYISNPIIKNGDIFFKEEYPINSASYNISPNPSKDKTIHIIRNGCSDNTSNDEITVNIYDNSSLVKSTTVWDSESMTISAEELSPGTYHIILSKGNNKIHSQTVIISD